jgi:hypothetical protein
MTPAYNPGDRVEFMADSPDECDYGTVIHSQPGHMTVAWKIAGETHDEDPDDDRIRKVQS